MEEKREFCLGGCRRMVLKDKGECRKCRRARLLAGRRRISKTGPSTMKKSNIKPVFETSKQKYNRVKNNK